MPGLGVRLTVLAGPTLPVPLPPDLAGRLTAVRVEERDDDRSGFSLTFEAGRSGPLAALDNPLLTAPALATFSRVVVLVTFGATPHVLADGVVMHAELTPGDGAGASSLTITCTDLSELLDRKEADVEHPALDDLPVVFRILAPYAAQGLVPMVVPPLVSDPPLPVERVPTQHGTDLSHLRLLASRHGYVCYVLPGPLPGTSRFYWGPPVRVGLPQPALSVDVGPDSNVSGMTFRQDAATPTLVEGTVQDPRTGAQLPVRTAASLRPPLAALPVWLLHRADLRSEVVRESGTSTVRTFARAQARVEATIDAVTAEGELDGARYGDVLRPRGLVGVRGAGWSHDGLWYVQRVEHVLRRGGYTQRFRLAREGYGSTVPAVRV